MPRYIPDGPLASNKRITEDVFKKCYHMELESASPYKVWAYRRAGWAIDELDRNIIAIYEKGGVEELQSIPGIGPSLATFIGESLGKLRFEQAK